MKDIVKHKTASNPLLQKMFDNAGISNDNNNNISQNWDELTEIYTAIAEAIVAIGTETNKAITIINSFPTNSLNTTELILSIKAVTSDLESFTKDLLFIKGRHSDMSGVVVDEEEHTLMLNIFQDYSILQERLHTVLMPSVLTITENLSITTAAIDKVTKESQLTDVNVVSDVEFKEEVKNEQQ